MIVGLVGKKGCGKDTAADYLVKEYGFVKYSLADPMKKAAQEIFLLSNEQLWGNQKEVIDPRYYCTPRKILQVMGTELFQFDLYDHIPEISKNIPFRKFWVYRFKQWYSQKNFERIRDLEDKEYGFNVEFKVVISDVRFPHETEDLRKMGAAIIKIIRHNNEASDNHASETEMEEIVPDFVVTNDGTINDLYEKLNNLFKTFE